MATTTKDTTPPEETPPEATPEETPPEATPEETPQTTSEVNQTGVASASGDTGQNNSWDPDNEEYFGVNPEYKNSAYEVDGPVAVTTDAELTDAQKAEAKAFENAKAREEGLTKEVGMHGYSTADQKHPSESRMERAFNTSPPEDAKK